MESITGEFSFLQAFGRFALVSVVTIGLAILGGCSNSRYDAPSDARTRAAYSTQQRANISMLCQAQGDYSSLLEAVYANANFCVYKLADVGADVNERTAEGDTLFHVAIKGGRSGGAHS